MNTPAVDLPVADREPVVVTLGEDGLAYKSVDAAISRAREDRSRRMIVLAPTSSAASAFGRARDLQVRQVLYGTPASVRGWSTLDVVVLPRWQERRDAEQTWCAMLPMLACAQRV